MSHSTENPATGAASGGAEKVVEISSERVPALAFSDLLEGLSKPQLWLNMAWHDIRQRFRRSILGPFWITLSMGIMVGALSLVFGSLFGHQTNEFIPYLATGLIFWNLITSTVNESGDAFVSAEGYVRNVPMPVSVPLYRVLTRNAILWAHNMVIYVLVALIFVREPTFNYLLFIPGFLLLAANLVWVSTIAAVISTRYRDIPQLTSNLLQVVFFVTPIFWSADQFPERPIFVSLNPAYHLLELARAPLLGHQPATVSWIVGIAMLPLGFAAAAYLYRRAYPRIAYWV